MSKLSWFRKTASKRSPREQQVRDMEELRRARLAIYYEDTYAKWNKGRTITVHYKSGYFHVKADYGSTVHKMREAKVLDAIAALERNIGAQEHRELATAGMEAGTGEDALPGWDRGA